MKIRSEPKWVAKWRELERLVDRKYEGYISIVGLSIHQFNEAPLRYFHISLTVRKYEFHIAQGRSRLAAIAMAIRVIKSDYELRVSSTVFGKTLVDHGLADETRVIKDCAYQKATP